MGFFLLQYLCIYDTCTNGHLFFFFYKKQIFIKKDKHYKDTGAAGIEPNSRSSKQTETKDWVPLQKSTGPQE